MDLRQEKERQGPSMDRPDPFFIVGHQRSGTTLLRVMLDRHPLVAVPPDTAGLIPDLYTRRDRYGREGRVERREEFLRDLASHPGFRRWGTSIDGVSHELARVKDPMLPDAIEAAYTAYARDRGKRGWGDKTPRYLENIHLLTDLFPQARFVHLIRDGRDVALSELDLHRLHTHAASVALLWRRKVGMGRAVGRALAPKYTELRYEDLVSDPQGQLVGLCRFLGLPFDPAMLAHDRDAIQEGLRRMPASARAQHQRLVLPPTKGLRDWRTQMDAREVAEFEAIAGQMLAETGYQLADGRIALTDRSRAWLHVMAFGVRSTGPRLRLRRREKQRWRDATGTDVGSAA